jgi:hypothetical protein
MIGKLAVSLVLFLLVLLVRDSAAAIDVGSGSSSLRWGYEVADPYTSRSYADHLLTVSAKY